MIIADTKFPYSLEIISINFIFILSLLGIRGWISTKMLSISTMNGNGGNGGNSNYKSNKDSDILKGNEEVYPDSDKDYTISGEARFMVKR
ncbi:MAG: hypothetical protein QXS19_06975 [Candidatus Methanomethylicia archaeon]